MLCPAKTAQGAGEKSCRSEALILPGAQRFSTAGPAPYLKVTQLKSQWELMKHRVTAIYLKLLEVITLS